jgi:hypothetical protein
MVSNLVLTSNRWCFNYYELVVLQSHRVHQRQRVSRVHKQILIIGDSFKGSCKLLSSKQALNHQHQQVQKAEVVGFLGCKRLVDGCPYKLLSFLILCRVR